MTLAEIRQLLEKAAHDPDLQVQILDEMDSLKTLEDADRTIRGGAEVALYGREKALPRFKRWYAERPGLETDLHGWSHREAEAARARVRRLSGSLGGTTRWLFGRQERSLRQLVHFLARGSPIPMPEPVLDHIVDWRWPKFKR